MYSVTKILSTWEHNCKLLKTNTPVQFNVCKGLSFLPHFGGIADIAAMEQTQCSIYEFLWLYQDSLNIYSRITFKDQNLLLYNKLLDFASLSDRGRFLTEVGARGQSSAVTQTMCHPCLLFSICYYCSYSQFI